MKQNNNSNARLLKMISGLQNQIDRLERKQPYDVVFYGTNSSDIAITSGVETDIFCDTVIMNQGIYFAPEVNGLKQLRWIVMSSGFYAISFSLFFGTATTNPLIRMYVGEDSTTFPTTRYVNIPVGNSLNLNGTSASATVVYLKEGWTFNFTVTTTVNTTLSSRTWPTANPSPLIHIAQVSSAYETPNTDNEWYYEDGDVEPR